MPQELNINFSTAKVPGALKVNKLVAMQLQKTKQNKTGGEEEEEKLDAWPLEFCFRICP